MTSNRILFATKEKKRFASILECLALDFEDVVCIDNGFTLLDAAIWQPTSAVLVDIELPGIPVAELIERIHHSETAKRPLIVPFGEADANPQHEAMPPGIADGFIALPCTDEAFVRSLCEILDVHAIEAVPSINRVQRSLLKVGRRCADTMIRAVESDEPVDIATVNSFCQDLVAAVRSDELLDALDALRTHHNYTFVHVLRVASTMSVFGYHLGMRQQDLIRLAQAGLLHDLGKLAISPEILHKPAPLSEDEWRIMKEHPTVTLEILSRSSGLEQDTLDAGHNHHERLDGSGYPRGLKGGQIDDLSLVCGIADVFSALTEKRSYKPRMSEIEAIDIMKGMAGHHLEPAFLGRFEEVVHAGLVR